jgi:hypothetical protein
VTLEDLGVELCGFAGVANHVAPSVTAGLDAHGMGHIVPATVAPALFVPMREAAIQLHGDLVFVVISVPVEHLAVNDDTHLMLGTRKAVRALDVTQIPVFEHGVNSVTGRRENIIQLGPPAHFLACRHGRAELFLRCKPPTAGSGNPTAGIIERPSQLSEVKHRLLDGCPERLTAELRGLVDAAGNADDEPGVVTRLVAGTVTWIASDGESMSPCSSAAV